jgi:hypothetical protein
VAEPLTGEQHRAADMIGRGWTLEKVSGEVGASVRTLERWKSDLPEFASAVKAARDKVLDEVPVAKAVAEAALSATKRNGDPDWTVRIQAARLLMAGAGAEAPDPTDAPQPTVIYVREGDGADRG